VSVLVRDAGEVLPLGNIRLETRCPGLEVYADPLLEKVFYNLIDNSLHYGGDTLTTIRVTTGEQGESLRIIVEDDGDGISAIDKQYLFTKGFGRHTGLGLFLSREILSITGISITENGIPGKGVRFEITVPKGEYRYPAAP
jgi:signal transduction histidine kinase